MCICEMIWKLSAEVVHVIERCIEIYIIKKAPQNLPHSRLSVHIHMLYCLLVIAFVGSRHSVGPCIKQCEWRILEEDARVGESEDMISPWLWTLRCVSRRWRTSGNLLLDGEQGSRGVCQWLIRARSDRFRMWRYLFVISMLLSLGICDVKSSCDTGPHETVESIVSSYNRYG